MECPICGELVPDVYKHCWFHHVHWTMVCFCFRTGIMTDDNFKTFKECCEQNGGLVAHYLECALRGEPRTR